MKKKTFAEKFEIKVEAFNAYLEECHSSVYIKRKDHAVDNIPIFEILISDPFLAPEQIQPNRQFYQLLEEHLGEVIYNNTKTVFWA